MLHARVVVGDERDARVVHAELAREEGLGILRHVDHVPALAAETTPTPPVREKRGPCTTTTVPRSCTGTPTAAARGDGRGLATTGQ